MFSKQAQIPLLRTIFIALFTAMILVWFMILLLQLKTISIEDQETRTQLVISKFLRANCFSDDFAVINRNLFTQEEVDRCFRGLDERIVIRARIIGSDYLYVNNKKSEFEQKAGLCNVGESNSQLCTKMQYPITLLEKGNSYSLAFLNVEIITLS